MKYTFYRLKRTPDENAGEGENWDEWFTSLDAAHQRRRELITEDPHLGDHPLGRDFQIDRVETPDLTAKQLVLWALNTQWVRGEMVTPPYEPKE